MGYESFIGARYLSGRRRVRFISLISLISIGGVAVGLISLITSLSVMNGAQSDLREKILGVNAHLIVSDLLGRGLRVNDELIKRLHAIKGVTGAAPFIYGQAILTSSSKASGVALRGLALDADRVGSGFFDHIIAGSIEDIASSKATESVETDEFGDQVKTRRAGVAIGVELSSILNVGLGDPIDIVSVVGSAIAPTGSKTRVTPFYVAAIFKSGLFEYDSSMAIISIEEAAKILQMGQTVTGIAVTSDDIYATSDLAARIESTIPEPVLARDWIELNANLFFALKLEKIALGVILALIIAVAAFNIASTLMMVALTKRQDIAILKALGATRWSIMKIFIIHGSIIGAIGVAIGAIGSMALCWFLSRYQIVSIPSDVYNLERLPVLVEPVEVALILSGALALSVAATIYPAWSGSRQDPVETLRYE